eukprot:evm.model.scf_4244.1 EVM.evm.TU.scf_4244.1   scf_4244:2251-2688(+)
MGVTLCDAPELKDFGPSMRRLRGAFDWVEGRPNAAKCGSGAAMFMHCTLRDEYDSKYCVLKMALCGFKTEWCAHLHQKWGAGIVHTTVLLHCADSQQAPQVCQHCDVVCHANCLFIANRCWMLAISTAPGICRLSLVLCSLACSC